MYVLAAFLALHLNPKVESGALSFIGRQPVAFSLMGLTYLVVFYIADLYDYQQDFRRWSNIARVLSSVAVGSMGIIILFYFPTGVFVGRVQLLVQTTIFAGLLLLWRLAFSALALPQLLRRGLLIIGAGGSGRRLLEALRKRPRSGLEAVGFIDDDPRKVGKVIDGLPVLGGWGRLAEIIRERRVDLAVVAITHNKSPLLISALTRIGWNGVQLQDMPTFYEFLAGKIPIDHISDLWVYLNTLHKKRFYYRHVKRLMDLGLALIGLTLTLPLFPIIAVVIKLTSPGKVFFRQDRLGQDGKPFEIIKFRTMVQDAENHGPQWARENDPRVTPVGRILRKLRLDEFPQLINIIRGDMSLIGPRPERECYILEFQEEVPEKRPGRRANDSPGLMVVTGFREKVPYYSYRLVVKPGITGWAQVMYSYASSMEETREKLKYDLFYIKNMGVFLDLAILLKTVRIVLFGRGT